LDKQNKDLLFNLIERSKADHTTFEFIRSWREYTTLRISRRFTKTIIKSLRSAINKLFKDYCKEVSSGGAQFNKLLAYSTLQDALRFYEEELSIITGMLDEYVAYLSSGHLINSFLFLKQRPEDQLWDHRG
jgi:hypothetical protein